VIGYDHGRRGEVTGLLLEDGTIVKVPPHEGARLSAFAGPGDTVRADGMRHLTRHGETHLRAHTVTDTATGESMSIHHPAR
jgi:hypothetical protein